jgi:hypothetical protein
MMTMTTIIVVVVVVVVVLPVTNIDSSLTRIQVDEDSSVLGCYVMLHGE